MTGEQWRTVEALFDDLHQLTVGQRAERLAAISDNAVRNEVTSLLAHSGPDETLEDPISAVAWMMHTAALDEQPELADRQMGPYRLVRRIGQGGMGSVYEAMRVDGYQQRVAIKIIQQELDSEPARARFQHERQLLAALEHPYIARLLDGGEAKGGSPYLVLEYVEGEPIHVHCARQDRTAKLRLFLKVCDAVEHAHRNLIVHRDLKPANILVTAAGDPKLLDFGIAKLLDPAANRTQTMAMALTPDYASPEQIRGLPISTASDVYSLGVVLYEILTGRKPYHLATTTPIEMDRVICMEAPVTPGLGDELDHILLMALRKEPERRYGSVRQFADDLVRYMDGRPVLARPDTATYRTRKYVRRHWVGLMAATVAVVAVVGASGAALYQARVAQHRFDDVRHLANWVIFDFDKEIASVPGNTKARQMLAATAGKYLDNLSITAGNDEELLAELATSYEKLGDVQGLPGVSNLGLSQDAAGSYAKAISILERLSLKNQKYRARLAADLGFSGRIAGELNQPGRALDLTSRAALLSDVLRAERPNDTTLLKNAARSLDLLTSVQQGLYRSEDALASSRKAARYYEQMLPASGPPKSFHALALVTGRMGMAFRNLGDLDGAAAALNKGLAIETRILKVNPDDLTSRVYSANLHEYLAALNDSDRYPSRGDPNASIAEWQEALRLYTQLADGDPNDVRAHVYQASAAASMALEYEHRNGPGDLNLADGHSRMAAAILDATLQKTPRAGFARGRVPLVGYVRALTLARMGKHTEANERADRTLAIERSLEDGSGASADIRLDMAGQLLHHAEILSLCHGEAPAERAITEAHALLAKLKPERQRWAAYAYQAGAYEFRLAHTLERAAREAPDALMMQKAAVHYAEASRLWSEYPEANRYFKLRIAEAVAANKRCRLS